MQNNNNNNNNDNNNNNNNNVQSECHRLYFGDKFDRW